MNPLPQPKKNCAFRFLGQQETGHLAAPSVVYLCRVWRPKNTLTAKQRKRTGNISVKNWRFFFQADIMMLTSYEQFEFYVKLLFFFRARFHFWVSTNYFFFRLRLFSFFIEPVLCNWIEKKSVKNILINVIKLGYIKSLSPWFVEKRDFFLFCS